MPCEPSTDRITLLPWTTWESNPETVGFEPTRYASSRQSSRRRVTRLALADNHSLVRETLRVNRAASLAVEEGGRVELLPKRGYLRVQT